MRRKSVFNYDMISCDSYEKAVDYIINGDVGEKNPVIATINLDQLVRFEKAPDLRDFVAKSFAIFPDGMPIVAASHIYGKALDARMSGADLFPVFWRRVVEEGLSVLCVTPSERVAELLKKSNPACLCWTPRFISSDSVLVEEGDVLIDLAKKVDFVVVGIGLPNRELLTKHVLSKLPKNCAPKFLLFGAAFEFFLGIKKRAPLLVRTLGFEWLHRFGSEPRRLFRRYFVESLSFVGIFFKYYK